MFGRLAATAVVSLQLCFASLADDEGLLTVELSILAVMGKCAQHSVEFTPEEWTTLSDHIRSRAAERGISRQDFVRVWMTSRGMFATIDAASCASTRRQIGTWFPYVSLRENGLGHRKNRRLRGG